MRLGFVGTGSITAAMVTGFCTAATPPERVLVSPRNAERAARLAAAFGKVEIASDNQAVLDGSDWVVLAVRPPVSREVLASLRFRPEHRVVSVIAALSPAELARLVAPATRTVRAVPLPPCARHVGPIAVSPADSEAAELFGRIGTVVEVPDEHRFDSLNATTALMSAFFQFEAEAAQWLVREGVDAAAARRFIAAMFHAVSFNAAESYESFEDLAAEAATPGGMNEQVLREMKEAGSYAPLPLALDHILARLQGRA